MHQVEVQNLDFLPLHKRVLRFPKINICYKLIICHMVNQYWICNLYNFLLVLKISDMMRARWCLDKSIEKKVIVFVQDNKLKCAKWKTLRGKVTEGEFHLRHLCSSEIKAYWFMLFWSTHAKKIKLRANKKMKCNRWMLDLKAKVLFCPIWSRSWRTTEG